MSIQEMFQLKGKSQSSVGAEGRWSKMAESLAQSGANLVICSRKMENCEVAAETLAGTGSGCFGSPV